MENDQAKDHQNIPLNEVLNTDKTIKKDNLIDKMLLNEKEQDIKTSNEIGLNSKNEIENSKEDLNSGIIFGIESSKDSIKKDIYSNENIGDSKIYKNLDDINSESKQIKPENSGVNKIETDYHPYIFNDEVKKTEKLDQSKSNIKDINIIDSKQKEEIESSDSDSDDEDENYLRNNNDINIQTCGIINLGNNCYLNSGLQILASCEDLIDLLQKNEYKNKDKILNLFKKAMKSLLNRKIYNPKNFINCFCKLNNDFVKGSQCCSQNFIRTIIMNINKACIDKNFELVYENSQYPNKNNQEYIEFIKTILPESKLISLFSGITQSHSHGICPYCNEKIDSYSFNYFLDQNMYLDDFECKCKFSDVLRANIGNENILTMDCPKCNKEIEIKDETKYIKLPNILIFTLERYQGPTNNVSIIPDEIIDVKAYTDISVKYESNIYELFAINIRFGSTSNFGHEICQVKRNGKWYEINDTRGYEIKKLSNFDCSYGLFYKIKKNIKDDINNELMNAIKINTNSSQNWFESAWNFLTSPLYSLFSKEKKELNYFKQGLYIISVCDSLIDELSTVNIKNRNLITITKKTILKIIESNIYDDSDFIDEFLKDNKVQKQDNMNNLQDFIEILIYNMNDEFIKIKYNLHDEKNIKYKPIEDKEKNKYKIFTSQIFPQSSILFTFSSIIKNDKYAKCKCGNIIKGYTFEHLINQKISLDNLNNSNFSYILNEIFSDKNKKIDCDKCDQKVKLKIKTKFIKLGDILIFTIDNRNKIIQPIEYIDLRNYIDDSLIEQKTKYELFAINFRIDIQDGFRHQICKIKRFGKWYEIGDKSNINAKSNYKQYICGLFYKIIR